MTDSVTSGPCPSGPGQTNRYRCHRCGHRWRDLLDLRRHLNRFIPCKQPPGHVIDHEQKANQEKLIERSVEQPDVETTKPSTGGHNNVKIKDCRWCNRYDVGTGHIKNCRWKDDPVRILEMEFGIEPAKIPISDTTCRFCTRHFSETRYLWKHHQKCEHRLTYLNRLTMDKESKPVEQTVPVPNGIPNEFLMEFPMEVIEQIIEITRTIKKQDHSVFTMAGKLVIEYHKLITSKYPEHNELVLPHHRCKYALVKTGHTGPTVGFDPPGWERKQVGPSLEPCFKKAAAELVAIRNKLESMDVLISENKLIKLLLYECEQFAESGFSHWGVIDGITQTAIRTGINTAFRESKYQINKKQTNNLTN